MASGDSPALPKSFVCVIDAAQRVRIEEYLKDRGFTFASQPYAFWKAAGGKLSLCAYESGKLTVQGADTPDFVQFFLEPEILKSYTFGQEAVLAAEAAATAVIDPHGGIDESGKGDFFGSLCVAAVYVDAATGPLLIKAGVRDSKTVTTDAAIARLANVIRNTVEGRFALVKLPPATYNRLYRRIGNLNRLLAWGHARAIENLLEKVPECPRMLSDQFGNETLILRALMEKGRKIKMDQETKAERDVAVAAASILARDAFVHEQARLSELAGMPLPRGASGGVRSAAEKLLKTKGPEIFEEVAKTHFRTYFQVMGLPEPERPAWHGGPRR